MYRCVTYAKKTAELIVESGNHYVMQVKGNQPSLFTSIEECIVEQSPLDVHHQQEKEHGRHTCWDVFVYDASHSPKATEWSGLRRYIHVHRQCFDTKTKSTVHSDRFYITDLFCTDASYYHRGIRGHWAIENNLHWVKDVRHGEDKNQIKKGNGPVNCSIISSIAINMHRYNGRKAIKDAQTFAMTRIRELIKKIRT